jgi:hypothetical protein
MLKIGDYIRLDEYPQFIATITRIDKYNNVYFQFKDDEYDFRLTPYMLCKKLTVNDLMEHMLEN